MDERLQKELEQAVAAWAATGEAQRHPELVALGLWQPSGAALTALGYNGPAVTKFTDRIRKCHVAEDAFREAEWALARAYEDASSTKDDKKSPTPNESSTWRASTSSPPSLRTGPRTGPPPAPRSALTACSASWSAPRRRSDPMRRERPARTE